MSAYMLDKAHIDALVATALDGPTDIPVQSGQWNCYTPRFGEDCRKLQYNDNSADVLGELLVKENLSSILSRYPDCAEDPSNLPGPADSYWSAPYHFPIGTKRLTIVQALKAIDCYEYQSCEHPEWENSFAHKFCEQFKGSLITFLPGYEKAAWSIEG
jgi:hypothetical protein